MAKDEQPTTEQGKPRRYWRLGSFTVVRHVDLEPGEAVYEGFIESYVDDWLRNPLARYVVDELLGYSPFGLGAANASRSRNLDVRRRLLDAFRRRELVLLDRVRHSHKTAGQSPEPVAPNAAPPDRSLQREKTWIEIQLVNKQGQPVAGAKYRLKITDGSVREGRLNENGSVHVPGLDPGLCEVTFPEYEPDEWMRD